MSRPVCRKCMFAEIDPAGVYREISQMIEALPKEKRTDEQTYRRRLEICGRCDKLGEGTCGVCGCFVELRAAKKDMDCPHEKHFWR